MIRREEYHKCPTIDLPKITPKNEIVDCAVNKIVQYFTKNDASNDNGAPGESTKSNTNVGSTFGRQNSSGGK